jgi:hypothetical protein
VRDSGVLLTIRYLCDPRERRMTTEANWEDVLAALAARDDVDFVYPTTRFYDDVAEASRPRAAGAPQAPGEVRAP